jgi:hypothetical protein
VYLSVPLVIITLILFAINVVSNARLALLMQIPAIPVLIQIEKCLIACVLTAPLLIYQTATVYRAIENVLHAPNISIIVLNVKIIVQILQTAIVL